MRCLASAEREVVSSPSHVPPVPPSLGGTTPYVSFVFHRHVNDHVPAEHLHVSYFCLEPRNLEPAPHHSFIMSAFIVSVSVSPDPSPSLYYVRDRRSRRWRLRKQVPLS